MLSHRAASGLLAISKRLPRALPARAIATTSFSSKKFNHPLTVDDVPRAAGFATMLRLPMQSTADGLDACFLGIPMDNGTFAHRTGARYD